MRQAKIALAAAGLAFTLGGCIVTPAPAPPLPPGAGVCNAAGAAFVIGRPATPPNIEAARVASGATVVRTLRPGEVITFEYRADRLNLELSPANIIVEASCG